jgi:hypothetical protein
MPSVYVITLLAHSYLRWALLVALLVLIARAWIGFRSGRSWSQADERTHVITVSLIDVQLLLGLMLYLGLSPYVRAFWAQPALGMHQAGLRFFGVEHLFSMLIALLIIHVARVRSKRAANGKLRHRTVFISTLLALLVICVGIPWPALHYGRPLVRGQSAIEPSSHALSHAKLG